MEIGSEHLILTKSSDLKKMVMPLKNTLYYSYLKEFKENIVLKLGKSLRELDKGYFPKILMLDRKLYFLNNFMSFIEQISLSIFLNAPYFQTYQS